MGGNRHLTMEGKTSLPQLVKAFRELQSRSASGILHITADSEERRIYFHGGRIVGAEANDDEEASTEEQRAIVRAVFLLRDGDYRFEEKSGIEVESSSLNIVPGELTVMSSHPDEATPSSIGWSEDAPLELPVRVAQLESTLSIKQISLLDVMKDRASTDTSMTTSDVIGMSLLTKEETLESLGALIAAGIVQVNDGVATDQELQADSTNSALLLGGPAPLFPSGGQPQKLGRFEVRHVLGRGSMGAVLLAQDPAIDRIVAIKLIQTAVHLPAAQKEKYKQRFYREASSAGQLIHPNIVTVYDVGHADDGTPFIVMEHVEGRTLEDILEKDVLRLDHAFRIAYDVLAGLSYAHAQNIVHRDIKPSNIMVTPDFRAKIMDFGIAHVIGSELTVDGDVLGTPYYMAPEQLSKGVIEQRTDLFSFAVVLYRMLTGQLPFTGDSFAAIAQAILNTAPIPPDRVHANVNMSLRNVILRCLEKNPSDRYDSVEDVVAALQSARDATHLETGIMLKVRRTVKARRNQWFPVAAAVALGAFLIIALIIPDRGKPDAEVGEPTPPSTAIAIAPDGLGEEALEPEPPSEAAPEVPLPAPKPRPKRKPEPKVARPAPAPKAEAPTLTDIFDEARMALERGDLEESQARLDELLLKDPGFEGASDLHIELTDQIWGRKLPLSYAVRHKHRLGGCDGELTITRLGIQYKSDAHDWAFSHEDIQKLKRIDQSTVYFETSEKNVLALGKNKRYRFEVGEELTDEDWTRYVRITR